MQWPRVETTIDGQTAHAIAPFVISASRATDIPAFYGEWFMARLKQGCCRWINPYNRKMDSLISFDKCRLIVFWTKNPEPFFQHLDALDASGMHYYFHYTLNDYEAERLEPGLPPLARRIEAFKTLSRRIGRHRVIWRFDPVLLGGALSLDAVMGRIEDIGRSISACTDTLVFSFLDMYQKTEKRLKRLDPSFRAPGPEEMLEFAERLVRLNAQWESGLRLATCAETILLERLGIQKNKCVDGALILRLCGDDPDIAGLYGRRQDPGQQGILAPRPESAGAAGGAGGKDSGQRTACACAPSKDIGAYDTCMHLCAYCYANASAASAARNSARVSTHALSLAQAKESLSSLRSD